ncbi:protein MAIN-LIKE 1-like [Euphorbia lathyris]|uniref:protein MAIN-LIKE 1-like n=1 Tax=Euphorbia lathyris TaxID=212925 RepID=UPI003313CC8E
MAVRVRVRELSFEPFILTLPRANGVCDRRALRALCERWVDSTHTFHLPFEEMTISPRDFSLLTGLRGSDTLVPLYYDMVRPEVDLDEMDALISPGVYTGVRSTPAKFVTTFGLLSRRDFCDRDDTDRATRSFLLYALGETVFRTQSGTIHAGLIQAFRDIDAVSSYDWAGASLAYLYRFLDLTCRQRKDFGGYTFALLV